MSLIWSADGQSVELQPADKRWSFWISSGREEQPQARTTSDLIPFRQGRLHKQGLADTRPIVLTGVIAESSATTLRSTADMLKGLLDPTLATAGLLVDTMPDGTQRWISALPRNVISTTSAPATRMVSVELESLDPYWLGAYGTATLDTGLLLDDGLYLDNGAEIAVVPTSLSHALSIDTQGSADVEHVRLRFVGPSSGSVGIEVDTPDGILGFVVSTPLIAGQELIVDNYARTATIGGVSQRSAMTLNVANRHGEYVRLLSRVNTIRLLGAAALVRLFLNPTYL